MTTEYTRPRPLPRPVVDIPTVRLQWAHSVLHERDFLSEWRELDCGADLAREFGHSQLVTDAFALPLRHKRAPHKVQFNPDVEVLLGMENDMHFQSICIEIVLVLATIRSPNGLTSLGQFEQFQIRPHRRLSWNWIAPPSWHVDQSLFRVKSQQDLFLHLLLHAAPLQLRQV